MARTRRRKPAGSEAKKSSAKPEEIAKMSQKFTSRRESALWAMNLANEDLDSLSPGGWIDIQEEVGQFINEKFQWWVSRSVPTEEVYAVQEKFQEIIKTLLDKKEVVIGTYSSKFIVGVSDIKNFGKTPYLRIIDSDGPLPTAELAARKFGYLLQDFAHVVQECPAPKPRGAEDEKCGRWFIGRPNQTFCSALCQNRASTRASRKKKRGRKGE